MAEKRESWCDILLKFSGKDTTKIELFDARRWSSKQAVAGLHRVRRGSILSGRWVSKGPQAEFYSLPQVSEMILADLEGVGGKVAHLPPHPLLRQRARVRWKPANTDGIPNAVQTWAASDPIRAYSGVWMIFLSSVGWVPCSEVTLLDHYGRELPHG